MAPSRILVADDDLVTLTAIQGLLRGEGHTLVTTKDGQAALDAVRADPSFDLLLLDVVMPGMDGIALCRELKQDAATAHIPFILISALRQDDAAIREGLQAGATGYLAKPIEDTALNAWVRAALRIGALERELVARRPEAQVTSEEVLQTFVKLSHAVNNPLQALYATVDLLTLRIPKSDAVNSLIVEILHHAEIVAQLVAQASLQARTLAAANKAAACKKEKG